MADSIATIFFKGSNLFRKVGNRLSSNDEWRASLLKWNKLDKQHQYRTNYPELGPESIIFDLGGYQGQWASDIFSSYLSKVYVFEPHPTYFENIEKRFSNNKKIEVFNFGLGARDEKLTLSTDEESSTVFSDNKNGVSIQIKKAEQFFEEMSISEIDLMKINIEGGEYELLDHLIKTGRVKKIKNLQIQFHHFVPDAEQLMKSLHEQLAQTHETTYLYKFLWENWKLKG